MYKGYETPPYEVLDTDGAIELRRYGPHVLAEVAMTGSRRAAIARGFRALARYIFGGNETGKRVAMTAPVTQIPDETEASGGWRVQFMMPSGHSAEDLPAPKDTAIRFVEVAPQTQAVIRFSGFWSDRRLAAKARTLRQWAESRGRRVVGPPRYYFYNDPFTMPFRRRNEVALVIAVD